MEWISTNDRLPEEGKYVLAKHTRGTWHDSQDQENVNCVVVKLVKGLSKEDRERMKKGEIKETFEKGWCLSEGWADHKRSSTYRACDEDGNNQRPYNWQSFGADSFFGQDISHWCEIPKLD
jgi:hypothetical protein